MGYHKSIIPKGELGEFSKVREEFLELEDAFDSGNKILQICEMSDLIGAIELYARKFNLSLPDLIAMKNLTESAFKDGERS